MPLVRSRHTVAPRAALQQLMMTVADAAPGDVDAPIGVVIGAALVVAVVATAIIPLALKPGARLVGCRLPTAN
jgi:hypothetical protein